jgi:hypothetical protein
MLVCCLYCLLGRDVVARAQHSCRGTGLPTKTAWGKCKGEPAALGTTPGDMQLHHETREVRLGACARRSHTREFNAHPGACHQWGAMTGCPQLRVDESVVAKPIPAILCCPGWDDAKGVKATAGSNDVVHRGISGTEADPTASMREPSVQHVVDGSACCENTNAAISLANRDPSPPPPRRRRKEPAVAASECTS